MKNFCFTTEKEIAKRFVFVLKLSHARFYCICIIACKICHGHSFIIPHTQLNVWRMLSIVCVFFFHLPFFLIDVHVHNIFYTTSVVCGFFCLHFAHFNGHLHRLFGTCTYLLIVWCFCYYYMYFATASEVLLYKQEWITAECVWFAHLWEMNCTIQFV